MSAPILQDLQNNIETPRGQYRRVTKNYDFPLATCSWRAFIGQKDILNNQKTAKTYETRIWKSDNNSPWMKEALWVCCISEEEKC